MSQQNQTIYSYYDQSTGELCNWDGNKGEFSKPVETRYADKGIHPGQKPMYPKKEFLKVFQDIIAAEVKTNPEYKLESFIDLQGSLRWVVRSAVKTDVYRELQDAGIAGEFNAGGRKQVQAAVQTVITQIRIEVYGQ